ncbi:MAG: sel1 repeat family protein [Deltaproteobacteria bacterium]|nr:sel1 repeat family protein [Deltaproteobacteria bacterium]
MPKNYQASFDWYVKAAEAGDARAMRRVGEMLFSGLLDGPDKKGALAWLEKAAVEGDLEAMLELAKILQDKDPEKAKRWLERAAAAGSAKASTRLGLMGAVEGDPEEAFRRYKEAAEAGDPEAQYCLGMMHLSGDGAPFDPMTAMDLIEKAAGQGYLSARDTLMALGF